MKTRRFSFLTCLAIVAGLALALGLTGCASPTEPSGSTEIPAARNIFQPAGNSGQEQAEPVPPVEVMVNVVWAPRDPCPNNNTWENPVRPAATITVREYGNPITVRADLYDNMETAPLEFPVGSVLSWDSIVEGAPDYQPILNQTLTVGQEDMKVRHVFKRICKVDTPSPTPVPPTAPPIPPAPIPPPTQEKLVCSPAVVQGIVTNQPATLTAAGGDKTYAWSSPGAIPETGSGPVFTVRFSSAGPWPVTVRSGSQTATCTIYVGDIPPTPPTCQEMNPSAFNMTSSEITVDGHVVNVKAEWKIRNHQNVTVALVWSNAKIGRGPYVKKSVHLSVTCEAGMISDKMSWFGFSPEHKPKEGAEYRLMLLVGNVPEGADLPANVTVLSSTRVN